MIKTKSVWIAVYKPSMQSSFRVFDGLSYTGIPTEYSSHLSLIKALEGHNIPLESVKVFREYEFDTSNKLHNDGQAGEQ